MQTRYVNTVALFHSTSFCKNINLGPFKVTTTFFKNKVLDTDRYSTGLKIIIQIKYTNRYIFSIFVSEIALTHVESRRYKKLHH
jgi:hypothetical protein